MFFRKKTSFSSLFSTKHGFGWFREGFGRVPGGFLGQNEVRNGSKFGSKKVVQTRSKKWSQTGQNLRSQNVVPKGGPKRGAREGFPEASKTGPNGVPATFIANPNYISHQNAKTCTWRPPGGVLGGFPEYF